MTKQTKSNRFVLSPENVSKHELYTYRMSLYGKVSFMPNSQAFEKNWSPFERFKVSHNMTVTCAELVGRKITRLDSAHISYPVRK